MVDEKKLCDDVEKKFIWPSKTELKKYRDALLVTTNEKYKKLKDTLLAKYKMSWMSDSEAENVALDKTAIVLYILFYSNPWILDLDSNPTEELERKLTVLQRVFNQIDRWSLDKFLKSTEVVKAVMDKLYTCFNYKWVKDWLIKYYGEHIVNKKLNDILVSIFSNWVIIDNLSQWNVEVIKSRMELFNIIVSSIKNKEQLDMFFNDNELIADIVNMYNKYQPILGIKWENLIDINMLNELSNNESDLVKIKIYMMMTYKISSFEKIKFDIMSVNFDKDKIFLEKDIIRSLSNILDIIDYVETKDSDIYDFIKNSLIDSWMIEPNSKLFDIFSNADDLSQLILWNNLELFRYIENIIKNTNSETTEENLIKNVKSFKILDLEDYHYANIKKSIELVIRKIYGNKIDKISIERILSEFDYTWQLQRREFLDLLCFKWLCEPIVSSILARSNKDRKEVREDLTSVFSASIWEAYESLSKSWVLDLRNLPREFFPIYKKKLDSITYLTAEEKQKIFEWLSPFVQWKPEPWKLRQILYVFKKYADKTVSEKISEFVDQLVVNNKKEFDKYDKELTVFLSWEIVSDNSRDVDFYKLQYSKFLIKSLYWKLYEKEKALSWKTKVDLSILSKIDLLDNQKWVNDIYLEYQKDYLRYYINNFVYWNRDLLLWWVSWISSIESFRRYIENPDIKNTLNFEQLLSNINRNYQDRLQLFDIQSRDIISIIVKDDVVVEWKEQKDMFNNISDSLNNVLKAQDDDPNFNNFFVNYSESYNSFLKANYPNTVSYYWDSTINTIPNSDDSAIDLESPIFLPNQEIHYSWSKVVNPFYDTENPELFPQTIDEWTMIDSNRELLRQFFEKNSMELELVWTVDEFDKVFGIRIDKELTMNDFDNLTQYFRKFIYEMIDNNLGEITDSAQKDALTEIRKDLIFNRELWLARFRKFMFNKPELLNQVFNFYSDIEKKEFDVMSKFWVWYWVWIGKYFEDLADDVKKLN